MATNWKGLQAYGCKEPGFNPPGETNPKHMAGGYFHANLSVKGSPRWKRQRGVPKKKSRTSLRTITGYKGKIFNPVISTLPLAEGIKVDRHGFVWPV